MARRRRTVVTQTPDISWDEDLTRSDLYDRDVGQPVQRTADPHTHTDPGLEGRDFMTGGVDLATTQHGAVATGAGTVVSRTGDVVTSGNASQTKSSGDVVPDAPYVEPMTPEEMLAVIDAELSNCSAQYSGELAENRIAAMRYYQGKMYDAPPGRSQHVSRDVADVVEWTMPQVMNALVGTRNVVLFDAQNEQDEAAAQLETDACEHVLFRDNPGFLVVASAVKDALLQKNGVVKVYWDESTGVEYEDYQGLTEQQASQLLSPQDGSRVDLVAASEEVDEAIIDSMTGEPLRLYDMEVRRYRDNAGCRVQAIPPEEFLVARDHNSVVLDKARFTAHKRLTTESELVSEGWPLSLVKDLPTYSVDETGEREERRTLEDEKDFGYDASDRAVRRIQVIECYVHMDRDRDGVAELLQVWVAGQGSYYLMDWAHVACNPFVGCTGILATHKFYGWSFYDRVKDLQDQKTDLVRNIQDNVRLQNMGRTLVVAGQVNLDDLLTVRPGGIVRQKAPGMVEQMAVPQVGEMGYRHLEYLDNVRTGRVGVSPDTASVAEAIAGDTAHGLERLMSAKEELTGLIIQMLANTLMQGMICKIRAVLQRYQKTPIHFKVRNKWQMVNPAEWTSRTGASVMPGLGNGDRLKRMRALEAVMAHQALMIDKGGMGTLVTEKNCYNAACEFVRATNLDDPSPFYQDPESPEAQAFRQMQMQRQTMEQQAQQQQAGMLMQATMAVEQQKELTKRMGQQADQLAQQSKLLFEYQKLAEQMKQAYTQLELEHQVDIAGEGAETEAA